jgi:hypothetical protein
VFRRALLSMVPMLWLSALFAVAVSLLPSAAQAVPPPDPTTGKGPWELVRNEKGIVVHRRAIAGSPLHEFRGTGVIEAPIASVLAVLNDAEHRIEWMKEAAANNRVESIDAYSEIFYSRTKAPWPVAHRDVVLRARTTIDPAAGQVRIEITSQEHPAWPPQKGVVRMPFLRGHWYLWPERGGAWTRAEYQVHANPGGSLPDWIVNMVSKKIPFETMAGMQQQVKRRTYPDFEKKLTALPEYQTVLQASSATKKADDKATAKPEAKPDGKPEDKPSPPLVPEVVMPPAT